MSALGCVCSLHGAVGDSNDRDIQTLRQPGGGAAYAAAQIEQGRGRLERERGLDGLQHPTIEILKGLLGGLHPWSPYLPVNGSRIATAAKANKVADFMGSARIRRKSGNRSDFAHGFPRGITEMEILPAAIGRVYGMKLVTNPVILPRFKPKPLPFMTRPIRWLSFLLVAVVFGGSASGSDWENEFASPPPETRPRCY